MTGLVILAAGASARLGQPKQALQYRGESLLQRSVHAGLQAGCSPIIVVTGAWQGLLPDQTSGSPVIIVHNHQWEEGMAASIRCGITALQQAAPAITEAVLMVCDQPFADAALLRQLIQDKQTTGKPIIASFYKDTPGVPALFSSRFFPELLLLQGQEGAKKLFSVYRQSLHLVPFPLGHFDIDTLSDYDRLHASDM